MGFWKAYCVYGLFVAVVLGFISGCKSGNAPTQSVQKNGAVTDPKRSVVALDTEMVKEPSPSIGDTSVKPPARLPDGTDPAPHGTDTLAEELFPVPLSVAQWDLLHPDTRRTPLFQLNSKKEILLPRLQTKGKVGYALYWQDNLGENIALFTQTGKLPVTAKSCDDADDCASAQLFVYHYTWQDSVLTLRRKIQDNVLNCIFDLYVGFLEQSVSITDLDEDGIAELSFAYILSCRSDVSPADMKILLLEGGEKYAVRGTMTFDSSRFPKEDIRQGEAEWGWGAYTIDPALNRAPRAFMPFAKDRWQQFKTKDTFTQL